MTSMSMGHNIVLDAAAVRAQLRWSHTGDTPDVDLCALVLNAGNRVDSDADFVFYNQTVHPSKLIRLMPKATGRYPSQAVEVDLAQLPTNINKVVLACSADDASLSVVRDLHMVVYRILDGTELARFDIGGTADPVLVAGEIYRRNSEWKFRAIGQSYRDGLGGLARDYGVHIDENESETTESDRPATARTIDAGIGTVEVELASAGEATLTPAELDLSALALSGERVLVDSVWFLHPEEFDGHLTLVEQPDRSQLLRADLGSLPGRVQHVLITVSSMHGRWLSDWPSLTAHISNSTTDSVLAAIPTAESASATILGSFSRTRSGWHWITVSRPADARCGRDLVTAASRALAADR